MPWAMAETRRRYPDLDIPWTAGPALKRVHELAHAEAKRRPIFVYPDLLEKDPLLAESFTAIPSYLLFQLVPRDAAPDAGDDAFLTSARAFTCTERCSGCTPCPPCEGCLLPPPSAHPTQETQLALAYDAAALNHARFAERVAEARELVVPLLARARQRD
jgi:hypothetical protein